MPSKTLLRRLLLPGTPLSLAVLMLFQLRSSRGSLDAGTGEPRLASAGSA